MSVLGDLLTRVREPRPEGGKRPLLIFDLDSTLLSTQTRNHVILQEFARDVGAPTDFFTALAKIKPEELGWNVMDDLRGRGFRHEPTLTRLRAFWVARFFRDEYLRHDLPVPGAVAFVNEVHAAGAAVAYLSGRDEPNMGRGTRASLKAHGFPVDGERVLFRLKRRFEDDDLHFKRLAVEDLRAHGEVVAAFENEPINANMFALELPGAQVIFLETVCSPDPPPLRPEILRLKDFIGG